MSNIFEEIERLRNRIQQMEIEQVKQDVELIQTFRDFEEISRLEAELMGIDFSQLEQALSKIIDFKRLREDEDKIKVLEAQLEKMEGNVAAAKTAKAQIHDDEEVRRLEGELTKMDSHATLNIAAKEIYVIHLLFNPHVPSEWSEEGGGGWRQVGAGTQYIQMAKAKARFDALKKQWPDYPIKIIVMPNH
jgi:vesicle coat complex subunit